MMFLFVQRVNDSVCLGVAAATASFNTPHASLHQSGVVCTSSLSRSSAVLNELGTSAMMCIVQQSLYWIFCRLSECVACVA
jgi:hypothetical protein